MYKFILLSISWLILQSCGQSETAKTPSGSGAKAPEAASGNYLSMKINGVEWKADHDVFGAFHPKGYDQAIIIAGSRGPKDKTEQSFNLNLFKTTGPGVFQIKNGNPDFNVVQLANMSPENFMYGSMMGFDLKVTITRASANPSIVEASFEGELTGNASDKIKITEGKFYYHE